MRFFTREALFITGGHTTQFLGVLAILTAFFNFFAIILNCQIDQQRAHYVSVSILCHNMLNLSTLSGTKQRL